MSGDCPCGHKASRHDEHGCTVDVSTDRRAYVRCHESYPSTIRRGDVVNEPMTTHDCRTGHHEQLCGMAPCDCACHVAIAECSCEEAPCEHSAPSDESRRVRAAVVNVLRAPVAGVPDVPVVRIWGRRTDDPDAGTEANLWAGTPEDVADMIVAALAGEQ